MVNIYALEETTLTVEKYLLILNFHHQFDILTT